MSTATEYGAQLIWYYLQKVNGIQIHLGGTCGWLISDMLCIQNEESITLYIQTSCYVCIANWTGLSRKLETLTQCWINAGPPSATPAQQ